MTMRMYLIARLATTLGLACGLTLAVRPARAADLAGVLGVAPAIDRLEAPSAPPALFTEHADDHTAIPAAAVATATGAARQGLRFPTRIVLLSGAAADDPRAFIVLGEQATEPLAPAAAAAQAPGQGGDPSAANAPDRLPGPQPVRPDAAPAPLNRGPDPLAGTPRIDPAVTGGDAEKMLATMLPPRSDRPSDWSAPLEPLHFCGEPRALAPCVPPPPCHPAHPPQPFDLVGQTGVPTGGPIYGGPCDPRSGTCHDGPLAPFHRVCDRLFDRFYTPR
jgi:hypothetical protein